MDEIDVDNLLDIEDLKARVTLYEKAKLILEGFEWCIKINKGWFDSGFYDKIGVFLFNIEPIKQDIDKFLWVIVGDIPSVYIDSSNATGQEALDSYCSLMSEWAENVLGSKSLEDCYPVDASPTKENADLLKTRIAFIRKELLLQE